MDTAHTQSHLSHTSTVLGTRCMFDSRCKQGGPGRAENGDSSGASETMTGGVGGALEKEKKGQD